MDSQRAASHSSPQSTPQSAHDRAPVDSVTAAHSAQRVPIEVVGPPVEVVASRAALEVAHGRRWLLPLVLYGLTWASCLWEVLFLERPEGVTIVSGFRPHYALALMAILTAHEFGHFFAARRYGVPASFPYFIPMPLTPIGTMGAVIAMHPVIPNRKALFDIAIAGPLAGLLLALPITVVGLHLSRVVVPSGNAMMLGEPLLFKLLAHWIFGALPEGYDIALHGLALAGWVGVFITALNMIPISQLDGGHILYALLCKKAHPVAIGLLYGALGAVGVSALITTQYLGWVLLIGLLFLFGPKHPPTADDSVPLGLGRRVLGWLMLLFVAVGFTPMPIYVSG